MADVSKLTDWMMTLAGDVSKQAIRVDVAVMMSAMTLVGDQQRVESVRHVIQSRWSFGRHVRARGESDEADSSPVMRSEKDDSDDGEGELIGAILIAREAVGKAAESLTGACRRVDGQIRMIPGALCRSVEKLPGDVLCLNRRSDVEDPMEAVILVVVIELLVVKIQPWHL